MIDEEILFLIHESNDIVSARLEIGSELDSESWTGLLTEAAVNTAGKVDTKPSWITASILTLS
jgi:hypothetical protein